MPVIRAAPVVWEKLMYSANATYAASSFPNDNIYSNRTMNMSIGEALDTVLSRTVSQIQDRFDSAIGAAVMEYALWYESFVTKYMLDLHEAHEADSEGVDFITRIGLPQLLTLSSRVHASSDADVQAVQRVLRGYRGLATRVTDLWGRADLVMRLVEDVETQLQRLGLLSVPAAGTITFGKDSMAVQTPTASVNQTQVRVRIQLPRYARGVTAQIPMAA